MHPYASFFYPPISAQTQLSYKFELVFQLLECLGSLRLNKEFQSDPLRWS